MSTKLPKQLLESNFDEGTIEISKSKRALHKHIVFGGADQSVIA